MQRMFILRNAWSSMQKRLESRKKYAMSGRALKISLFDDFKMKTNKYKRFDFSFFFCCCCMPILSVWCIQEMWVWKLALFVLTHKNQNKCIMLQKITIFIWALHLRDLDFFPSFFYKPFFFMCCALKACFWMITAHF